jgi:hypothetical protein
MTSDVSASLSELHEYNPEDEEFTGPLESMDLFVEGRGIRLLVNVTLTGVATYSLSVDGVRHSGGYITKPLA